MNRPLAPHVAAALGRGSAPAAATAQPARPGVVTHPAAHVTAAVQAAGWQPPARPRASAVPSAVPPAAQAGHPGLAQAHGGGQQGTVQTQPRNTAPGQLAAHVRNAIQMRPGTAAGAAYDGTQPAASDYVLFEEKKLGGAPPPPPRNPVYTLSCDDKGQGCSLRDITTGRMQPAQNLYAGFVRMGKGSTIYVSPRPGVGLQGDSHPTIAARTPEWQRGQRAVVAGGEVGIIDGKIVGHNDKTGHFQSRRNLRQSGMPSDLFHPFTEDPSEWYRPPE